jgi:Spy/CpxP family protein refolding chaperone
MDMKKWIVGCSVVLLAALSVAFAGYGKSGIGVPHGFQGRHGHFMMSQRILALLDNDQFRAKINLTDDQASRLRQVVVNSEKSAIETRAQMAVDGIELREMLRSDQPDKDAVMKKVEEISSLREQMMKNGVQAILEAKTVLTPQQQKQVREFMESRFARGGWGAQGREHHRGGMMRRQGPRNMPAPSGQPSQ